MELNDGMIKKENDLSYHLDYLIILPTKDSSLLEAFSYTFGNVYLFNNTIDDLEGLNSFLKRNVISKLVFVDYYAEFDEVINALNDEHEIKAIFTKGFGELSDPIVLNEYLKICEKYDSKIIDEIGFLDPNLCDVVRQKRRKVKKIMLDIPFKKEDKIECSNNTVGLLNSDNSNYDSFFNELGSFVLMPNYRAKVYSPTKITHEFAKEYRIDLLESKSFNELVENNICNMCINFSGTNPTIFLRSMDLGIPCIVGNNYFLNKSYPELKKYLELKSDDDVNEISEKVISAIKNKKIIMNKYKIFRKNYKIEAKELAKKFLGAQLRYDTYDYEKLLTVVVPVYNTQSFLPRCLDSIIDDRIPGMEVLIIDDGSTDSSIEIASNYCEKYPDLIRVITQKNSGLGNVRNIGLREARGKYLASVDSDDTIQKGFFTESLKYLKEDVDVVIFDWLSVSDETAFETVACDAVFNKRKEYEGLLYTTIMPSTCNKIIKTEIFRKNNLKYLEQKYEDLSVNPVALLLARTVKYIKKPFYNYYLRNGSLMRSKIDPKNMVDAINYLQNNLKKNTIIVSDEFIYYTYSWRIEEYIINAIYELKGKELETAVDYIYEHFLRIMLNVFNGEHYKGMLDKLNNAKIRDYIVERNDAIRNKQLIKFIKSNTKRYKLTAGIIYYGD